MGSRICKYITNIVNSDLAITEYRRTFDRDHRGKVRQLYDTQLLWYRELTHNRTVTGDTSPLPSLHVTDIYLDKRSDNDTVMLTGELMCGNSDTIVSVTLRGEESVDPPLHELQQCPNLAALSIGTMRYTEDQTVAVIPRLTQLDTLRYNCDDDAVEDSPVVAAVLRLTQLRCIQLYRVSLGYRWMDDDDYDDDNDYDDDMLVLTADWTRLTTVVLYHVRMSGRRWGRFLSSLLTIRHSVHVTLEMTNIDDNTVGRIQTSPHFTVTRDYKRSSKFTFTTVCNIKQGHGMMGEGVQW